MERLRYILRIMWRAVHHYPALHQKDKMVEEMGELQTALIQERDGRVGPEAVITEIADVLIVGLQLALIYGLGRTFREVERKTRRLERRIAE